MQSLYHDHIWLFTCMFNYVFDMHHYFNDVKQPSWQKALNFAARHFIDTINHTNAAMTPRTLLKRHETNQIVG